MIEKQQKRNGSIDFWKFIFSILILIFHSKNLADNDESLFIGGAVGVEFFFLVSGVFLAVSEERLAKNPTSLGQTTFQFMKKKIVGLMPDIYIAWIVAFFVEHIGKFSIQKMVKDAFTSIWELLFLTNSGLSGYRCNHVTWYISAMLLVMLFLFPLMRKYKDSFFYIIAPLSVIFLMGISCHTWDSYRGGNDIYRNIVRATIGLMLGCLCYKAGKKIRSTHYTSLGKILLTLLEWLGYGIVIAWSFNHRSSKMDWIMLLPLALAVTISFSQTSLTDSFFSRYGIFNKLGQFSFDLYLGHGYWSHKMKLLFPQLNYYQRLPIYIGLAIITGLFIMFTSGILKKWWGRSKGKCKTLIIQAGQVEE